MSHLTYLLTYLVWLFSYSNFWYLKWEAKLWWSEPWLNIGLVKFIWGDKVNYINFSSYFTVTKHCRSQGLSRTQHNGRAPTANFSSLNSDKASCPVALELLLVRGFAIACFDMTKDTHCRKWWTKNDESISSRVALSLFCSELSNLKAHSLNPL